MFSVGQKNNILKKKSVVFVLFSFAHSQPERRQFVEFNREKKYLQRITPHNCFKSRFNFRSLPKIITFSNHLKQITQRF